MDESDRPIVVLDAPSDLGLRRPAPGARAGTRDAPAALRAAGLLARLRADDAGAVSARDYDDVRDPCGVLHAPAVAAFALALADALAPALDAGALPLVLGGDCSIVLGPLLALRRRGRAALLYVDGHRDLLTPSTSASGGACGMALALACGLGPRLPGFAQDEFPLVDPADVVLFGHRDEARWYDPDVLGVESTMRSLSLEDARIGDFERMVRARLDLLLARGERVWLHLDADVLDDALMPAVDSRAPGGMSADELVTLLRMARASGRLAGLDLTIYDPGRDPARSGARLLVDLLARGLLD